MRNTLKNKRREFKSFDNIINLKGNMLQIEFYRNSRQSNSIKKKLLIL